MKLYLRGGVPSILGGAGVGRGRGRRRLRGAAPLVRVHFTVRVRGAGQHVRRLGSKYVHYYNFLLGVL